MSGTAQCMAWLQQHALEDRMLAEAYEESGPKDRSVLKLCIARLHAFWGERPCKDVSSRSFLQGFTVIQQSSAVPYALVFCRAEYTSPEHLLAACLPAVLAGVPHVIPCLVTGPSSTAAPEGRLLAALELAGLERCVCVSPAEAQEGLALFSDAFGVGGVLVLGADAFGEPLVLAARRKGISAISLITEAAAVTLDAAHAGVWIWPGLGPDCFFTTSIAMEAFTDRLTQ